MKIFGFRCNSWFCISFFYCLITWILNPFLGNYYIGVKYPSTLPITNVHWEIWLAYLLVGSPIPFTFPSTWLEPETLLKGSRFNTTQTNEFWTFWSNWLDFWLVFYNHCKLWLSFYFNWIPLDFYWFTCWVINIAQFFKYNEKHKYHSSGNVG